MMQAMRDLYQQVIMDHNRNPRNFGPLADATVVQEGHNPLCGDKLTLHLKVVDGIVEAAKFEGMGCAISKSSASLMTEAVKGKPVSEVKALAKQFHLLVTREGDADLELLGKLKVFAGVGEFPARVKCAKLGWRSLEAALEGESDAVSTE